MRYVESKMVEYNHDLTYRIYITDTYKAVFRLNKRFYELINNQLVNNIENPEEEANKTISRIKGKLKKLQKGENDNG